MEVRYEITFEICNTVHPGDGCTVRFWQYGSKCCWRNISLGHYQLNFPGWRSHGQYWRVGLRVGGRPYDNSDQLATVPSGVDFHQLVAAPGRHLALQPDLPARQAVRLA